MFASHLVLDYKRIGEAMIEPRCSECDDWSTGDRSSGALKLRSPNHRITIASFSPTQFLVRCKVYMDVHLDSLKKINKTSTFSHSFTGAPALILSNSRGKSVRFSAFLTFRPNCWNTTRSIRTIYPVKRFDPSIKLFIRTVHGYPPTVYTVHTDFTGRWYLVCGNSALFG